MEGAQAEMYHMERPHVPQDSQTRTATILMLNSTSRLSSRTSFPLFPFLAEVPIRSRVAISLQSLR